jgi:hypothetical protein
MELWAAEPDAGTVRVPRKLAQLHRNWRSACRSRSRRPHVYAAIDSGQGAAAADGRLHRRRRKGTDLTGANGLTLRSGNFEARCGWSSGLLACWPDSARPKRRASRCGGGVLDRGQRLVEHPPDVGGVAANDRHGQDTRHVVRVVPIRALDDRRHQFNPGV